MSWNPKNYGIRIPRYTIKILRWLKIKRANPRIYKKFFYVGIWARQRRKREGETQRYLYEVFDVITQINNDSVNEVNR